MGKNEIKGAIKDYVKECDQNMNDAVRRLKNMTKLERKQVQAMLESEIIQLDLWSSIMTYTAFAVSVTSVMVDIWFKSLDIQSKMDQTIIGDIEPNTNIIISVLVWLFLLCVFSVTRMLKKGKYVKALKYLELLEEDPLI